MVDMAVQDELVLVGARIQAQSIDVNLPPAVIGMPGSGRS